MTSPSNTSQAPGNETTVKDCCKQMGFYQSIVIGCFGGVLAVWGALVIVFILKTWLKRRRARQLERRVKAKPSETVTRREETQKTRTYKPITSTQHGRDETDKVMTVCDPDSALGGGRVPSAAYQYKASNDPKYSFGAHINEIMQVGKEDRRPSLPNIAKRTSSHDVMKPSKVAASATETENATRLIENEKGFAASENKTTAL